MTTPSSPEDFAALLRQYAGALYTDWTELEADNAKGGNYNNIAAIEADVKTQLGNMEALQSQLQTLLANTPPGPAQDALSNVLQSVASAVTYLSRAQGDFTDAAANPANATADYEDAQVELQLSGIGADSMTVTAYRQAIQWAEAQVQQAITAYNANPPTSQTTANAQAIQNLLQGLSTYIGTMSPADAAGALGITTTQLGTFTTALASTIKDITGVVAAGGGALPAAFTADWASATGIIPVPTIQAPSKE
jgi:hypothetical protein